jgi:hypothetical protein
MLHASHPRLPHSFPYLHSMLLSVVLVVAFQYLHFAVAVKRGVDVLAPFDVQLQAVKVVRDSVTSGATGGPSQAATALPLRCLPLRDLPLRPDSKQAGWALWDTKQKQACPAVQCLTCKSM